MYAYRLAAILFLAGCGGPTTVDVDVTYPPAPSCDAGAPSAATDAGHGPCLDRVMCKHPAHFDRDACACVVPDAGLMAPPCVPGQDEACDD